MPTIGLPGAFGAGDGSAGFGVGSARPAPAAMLFDPTTKDLRLNADGTFATVDPVDQEVALALCLRRRSIGSAPDAGSDVRNLARQGGRDYQAKVEDIVRRALKLPLARGAIRIVAIGVQTPIRGTTFVQVTYVNLTLESAKRQPQTQSVLL